MYVLLIKIKIIQFICAPPYENIKDPPLPCRIYLATIQYYHPRKGSNAAKVLSYINIKPKARAIIHKHETNNKT